jgi:hypothetical protein
MMQTIKLVHFLVRREIAPPRGVHTSTYRSSLFVGQPVHATATRFDLASNICKFFLVLFRPRLNLFQQCFCSRAHVAEFSIFLQFCHFSIATQLRSKPQSTFAGAGCSGDAFATRAALAIPASAAIFFCGSEPGCTTPADMIRVAASSALMSISMILLLGT